MKQFDLMFPSKPYTVRCSTTPEGEPNACWLIWFALTTSRRSPVPNMDHVPGRSILSHMTQSHVVFLFPMSPAQRMETKMFLSSRGDTHPPLLHPSITPPPTVGHDSGTCRCPHLHKSSPQLFHQTQNQHFFYPMFPLLDQTAATLFQRLTQVHCGTVYESHHAPQALNTATVLSLSLSL